MNLTLEDLQRYRDEGCLVFPGLIHGETLAHFKHILDTLVRRAKTMNVSQDDFLLQPDGEGKPIPGRLQRVQGLCIVEPRILAMAREPRIVERVTSLIGPQLHMFGSKFFPMLPQGGTSTGWHQDNYYFNLVPANVLTIWVALDPIDEENGCLRFVRGSHKDGVRPHSRSSILGFSQHIQFNIIIYTHNSTHKLS